ncbi:MAG: hemerythrin domain-containing protein [Myxococcaceae bacterium]|nr:hemerythrin domain-containing protein [Myxococcaceae bacterium]
MTPTTLLNDDGKASMATLIMTSHHGFRRDLGRFAEVLAAFEPSRAPALAAAWKSFGEHLHGHHQVEDTGLFPSAAASHPQLGAAIGELSKQHERIDPLLARGAAAFEGLPATLHEARRVVAELSGLLDVHLDLEEAAVIPTLRSAREFPPLDEAGADLYAQGFAWSLHGIAPDVTEQILKLLPAALVSRLPAARAAFDAGCVGTFGSAARASASRTSIPR